MASTERRGSGWRARWRAPDGRTLTKQFRTKVEAEQYLVKVQHGMLTGAYVDPRAGRQLLRDSRRSTSHDSLAAGNA